MIDIGRGVKLIRRSEWGARAPRSTSEVNATFGTTAHWEGPHMGYPWDHAACFSVVRGIQNFHMDTRGWQDIAYSGLPCPHGYVFEGRWAGRRTAANGTNDGNNRALALCYLGGQGDAFTPDGERAMRAGMDWLDAHGGAGPGRNGHRDWKPTECPGNAIYGWVHRGQPAGGTPTPPPQEDDMPLTDADVDKILDELTERLDTDGHPLRRVVGEIVGGQVGLKQLKPIVAWAGSGPVYLVDSDQQTKRLLHGWNAVHLAAFLGASTAGTFSHHGHDRPKPHTFEQAWLDSIDTLEPDPAEG